MDKLPKKPTGHEIEEYLATRKFTTLPPDGKGSSNVRSLDGLIRCAQYYAADAEPKTLFVMIAREPDPSQEIPEVILDIVAYYSASALKEKLSPAVYNEVRVALGLNPIPASGWCNKGNAPFVCQLEAGHAGKCIPVGTGA